jgi:hypothetical protein
MRLIAAALLATLALPALAAETLESDDWYAVYVNGAKAGQAHTSVIRVDDETAAVAERWITTSETHLTLSRAGSAVELTLGSLLEEDADGRVISYRQVQKLSGREIVTQGRVDGGVIRLIQNDVPGEVEYPEGAIGPAATDRRVLAAGFEPDTATEIFGFTIDHPASGAHLVFTAVGDESKRVVDRRLRLHRVQVENSTSAARSLAMWYDGNGRMYLSESDVPGLGVLRMVKTTETLAKTPSSPAEVFSASLIEPDRGIPSPRRATHAVFRLSRKDGEPFNAEIYAGEGQAAAEPSDAGSVDVTITAWTPPEGFRALRRPISGEGRENYLAKAAYLETDDARVRAHAERAVGDEKDALVCARKIEAYVRRFVSDKSMDVGFATAAEVAESGEGDCSEHAMLCAAIARVAGLPSRVVMGLVYVPGLSAPGVGPRGAFGYHMWTEVLVAEDRWFPIDAAMGQFDATHVAMGKSDLATTSPISQMILPLLEAIASVRIEIVEVR